MTTLAIIHAFAYMSIRLLTWFAYLTYLPLFAKIVQGFATNKILISRGSGNPHKYVYNYSQNIIAG